VIRKKVNNTVSIALKRYKIDSYILLDLDKVLNDVYCSFRPVSADYNTRKELVKNLNTMALDIYGNVVFFSILFSLVISKVSRGFI
jgi:hypothetical protein